MWHRVNDDVHAVGGKIMAQLWHTGLGRLREFAADPDSPPPLARWPTIRRPSTPLAAGGIHPPGRAISQADIDATIEEYAAAAANAQAAGFDGIELHAAHGHPIDQFFWLQSNRLNRRRPRRSRPAHPIRRRDHSGDRGAGSAPSFPIGLRFSQWKLPEHYTVQTLADPAELEVMLTPLTEAAFTSTTRQPAGTGRPNSTPSLTLAGWTKKITARHVIMVGSVGLAGLLDTAHMDVAVRPEANLGRVVAMIETGRADLVGVGRALLSNPDWGNKVRGRLRRLGSLRRASPRQSLVTGPTWPQYPDKEYPEKESSQVGHRRTHRPYVRRCRALGDRRRRRHIAHRPP